MKKVLVLTLLSLLLGGCAGRESAFQEWKLYLESTPSNAIDPQHATALISRVWEREKDQLITSMWNRARGANREDGVAACSILCTFVTTPAWHESGQSKSVSGQIDAPALLDHMNSMDTNSLSARWQEIHRFNLESLKQSLLPSAGGDGMPLPQQ